MSHNNVRPLVIEVKPIVLYAPASPRTQPVSIPAPRAQADQWETVGEWWGDDFVVTRQRVPAQSLSASPSSTASTSPLPDDRIGNFLNWLFGYPTNPNL